MRQNTVLLIAFVCPALCLFVVFAYASPTVNIRAAVLRGAHLAVLPPPPIDQCTGTTSSAAIGDQCETGSGGGGTHAMFGGGPFAALGNYKYMITPSGCGADPENPGCNISNADTLKLSFGPLGVANMDARSTTDGAANTNALVNTAGAYPLAEYCDALVWGGYTDWFLPAHTASSTTEVYLVLYAMKVAGKGNFQDSFYSSSTEYDTDWHVMLRNNGGWAGNYETNTTGYIRCVRKYQ